MDGQPAVGGTNDLITPHRGLETRAGEPVRVHPYTRLITPHGDWKPEINNSASGVITPARFASHYPSWGLEIPLADSKFTPRRVSPAGGVDGLYETRRRHS